MLNGIIQPPQNHLHYVFCYMFENTKLDWPHRGNNRSEGSDQRRWRPEAGGGLRGVPEPCTSGGRRGVAEGVAAGGAHNRIFAPTIVAHGRRSR
jgi:hypothetical protein